MCSITLTTPSSLQVQEYRGPPSISWRGGVTGGNQCGCGLQGGTPLQPQRKMLRLDSRLNNVVRVFVRATDFRSLLVEEMFPISSDLVPKEEKLRGYEVLSTYADYLSKGLWDLSTSKGVRHAIDTGAAKPIQVLPRRVPFHKRQEMPSQVDEMLKAEIIELSDSLWSCLVVEVAKPFGSQRFCADYRALNLVTK